MRKKILVVSPNPTHPQNSGNRTRIHSLLLNLKEMGHDVYFVHITNVKGDRQAMQQFWGEEKFYSIPYEKPQTTNKFYDQKAENIIIKITRKILRKVQAIIGSDPYFTYLVDDWYTETIDKILLELSTEIKPDVVMVEYVFFSKALECFDKNVLKIIDTHDIFADRYKLYLKNKQKPPHWYSTTIEEENKGLNRADIIIAIQQKEADILVKRLKNKNIVTVGHLVTLHPAKPKKIANKILFVGSDNAVNVSGINYFINNVFSQLKSKLENVQLILAGDICDRIEKFDGCMKLGRVENIEDAYDLADVVVSPILFGTGLKIKNIESLGYAKPLITTPAGAEGMEEGMGKAFLVANSPEEYVSQIVKILSNADLYENLSSNGYEFAKQWNSNCLQVLRETLTNGALVGRAANK